MWDRGRTLSRNIRQLVRLATERDYMIPDPDDPLRVHGSGLGGRISRWDGATVSMIDASALDVRLRAAGLTSGLQGNKSLDNDSLGK